MITGSTCVQRNVGICGVLSKFQGKPTSDPKSNGLSWFIIIFSLLKWSKMSIWGYTVYPIFRHTHVATQGTPIFTQFLASIKDKSPAVGCGFTKSLTCLGSPPGRKIIAWHATGGRLAPGQTWDTRFDRKIMGKWWLINIDHGWPWHFMRYLRNSECKNTQDLKSH